MPFSTCFQPNGFCIYSMFTIHSVYNARNEHIASLVCENSAPKKTKRGKHTRKPKKTLVEKCRLYRTIVYFRTKIYCFPIVFDCFQTIKRLEPTVNRLEFDFSAFGMKNIKKYLKAKEEIFFS